MDTKTKRRTPPREPGYHRLTDEKRIIIETLRKEGRTLSYIAERIGCSKSTVSKEIKRNKSKRGYRHKKANGKARARLAASRRPFGDGSTRPRGQGFALSSTTTEIFG